MPESLPNAITEPENVIVPTKVLMNNSTRLPYGIGSPGAASSNADGSATTAYAMHTAARPISECIAATSSGIFVISTFAAIYAPAPPPTISATNSRDNPSERFE